MKIAFDNHLPKELFPLLQQHEVVSTEEDAEVLMSSVYLPVTRALVAQMPSLRLVANYGVGYDNIDLQVCAEKGIMVTNTPQPVIEPTAELCMTLMLTLCRRTSELCEGLRNGSVTFGLMNNLGRSLYGKTLGIIGMGHIGKAVARRAVASGMHIIYHNRHALPSAEEKLYNARYVSMDEILQESDFLSLNLPYSQGVRHLIDEAALGKMKPSAYLINTARGPLVDEEALAAALQQHRIAGAAMDVFEHEPQITPALLTLQNCVVVPHIGTATLECRQAMAQAVEDNVRAYLSGDVRQMTIVKQA